MLAVEDAAAEIVDAVRRTKVEGIVRVFAAVVFALTGVLMISMTWTVLGICMASRLMLLLMPPTPDGSSVRTFGV